MNQYRLPLIGFLLACTLSIILLPGATAEELLFPDVLDPRNAAFLNYGVVVTKFTGARGKSGTSDASAEFVAEIRNLMDENRIIWQTGELGKVDAGGGGTVALYIANMDVDTIDVGVPVMSMHAPMEVVSKIDVYMAYKAFLAFISDRS